MLPNRAVAFKHDSEIDAREPDWTRQPSAPDQKAYAAPGMAAAFLAAGAATVLSASGLAAAHAQEAQELVLDARAPLRKQGSLRIGHDPPPVGGDGTARWSVCPASEARRSICPRLRETREPGRTCVNLTGPGIESIR